MSGTRNGPALFNLTRPTITGKRYKQKTPPEGGAFRTQAGSHGSPGPAGEREATGGFREGRPCPFSYAARSVARISAAPTVLVVPAVISPVISPVIATRVTLVVPTVVAPIAVVPAIVVAVVSAPIAIAVAVVVAPIAVVIPVVKIVVIDPVVAAATLVEPYPVPATPVLIVVSVAPAVVVNDDDASFPTELPEPAVIEMPVPDANPLYPAYMPGAVVIVSITAIPDDDAAADRPATNADVRLHTLCCRRGGRKQGQQEGGTENKIASAHGILPEEERCNWLSFNASAVPLLIPLHGNRIVRRRGPICPPPGTSPRWARDIAEGLQLYSARRLIS